MSFNDILRTSEVQRGLMGTLGLLVVIWSLRALLIRQMAKSKLPQDVKRRWLVTAKNLLTVLFVLGLAFIWAKEIQNFALSIVAIAAALVIATKELILCILGGIVKASSQAFSIGDRIEIDEIRGDVIDSNFLTTKILEIGPKKMSHQYTGRSIIIPNSYFLNKPVHNESYMRKYVLHVFTVPFSLSSNWQEAHDLILQAAKEECQSFINEARDHMEEVTSREGLEMPSIEPRITLFFPKPGDVDLIVRIPSPEHSKGRLEQKIIRDYLKKMKESQAAKDLGSIK